MGLKTKIVLVLPVLLALSLVYAPYYWVNLFVLIDYLTPWVLFDSPLYDAYHNFLVDRLPERAEYPLPEITPAEVSKANIEKLTKMYTFPLIIRGMLNSTDTLQKWSDRDW